VPASSCVFLTPCAPAKGRYGMVLPNFCPQKRTNGEPSPSFGDGQAITLFRLRRRERLSEAFGKLIRPICA